MLVERPLKMGGKKTVLHVHPGRQAQFRNSPQDERLVGSLLRVLSEKDDPARVQRAIDVVMPTVHVQCMFSQRAGSNLQNYRRAFAGCVVVLFHSVHDPLSGSEIDDALAANRMGDGTALGSMFSLCLHRESVAAKNMQASLGE